MLDRDSIKTNLLNWWDAGHAELPWRLTKDPYAIWISEIMLQQTQIVTVIPYFEQWMNRFPTIPDLAKASIDEVLKMWEGLGYYSRARNLHKTAGILVQKYDGRLPDSLEELISLPGIGRYTAGAIASIAFNQPVPVLDGNVTRILTRLNDLPDDISKTSTTTKLWKLAGSMVTADRPGDFNQALMELGQQICGAANPQCSRCPLSNICLARERGTQFERPVRPQRKRIPHHDVVAGVIWQNQERSADSKFLITQRPFESMLGGLWEFPGGKKENNEKLTIALQREIEEELAIKIIVKEPLATIQHAYTHFRITLHAFQAFYQEGTVQHLGVIDHAWVTIDDLPKYAFAATDRQIAAALQSILG